MERHHHCYYYDNNNDKQLVCSYFRKEECQYGNKCQRKHLYCLNGDECEIMEHCKFLHPFDPAFQITCKKPWDHCAY